MKNTNKKIKLWKDISKSSEKYSTNISIQLEAVKPYEAYCILQVSQLSRCKHQTSSNKLIKGKTSQGKERKKN